MADRKLKNIGRSASTESTEYSVTMGKSIRRKKPKPKERWLLTRKTWRYMADAGRKLIPDGTQNRIEDVPKIEAYFQEVCKKETKFLLWRKNSYPGAIGFRKKKRVSRKGNSCRKAVSADEVSLDRPERPTHLEILPTTSGKFDLREEASTSTSYDAEDGNSEQQLAEILREYLQLEDKDTKQQQSPYRPDFSYQDLVDRLQRHLNLHGSDRSLGGYQDYTSTPHAHQHVHFQGDYHQRSLLDTLSRYYGQTGNRDRIISDLLTDRKALEKLYFDLRKTKGFRGSRGGTGYTTSFAYGPQRTNYPASPPHSILKGSPSASVSPPMIEVQRVSSEPKFHNWATQTLPIPEVVLVKVEEEFRKKEKERREEEAQRDHKSGRRKSSIDNDDVSQSVSDTIKRYLRMARKKSVDIDKADRFKRVNYDRNLRNIKAKGEITKPGDDDGLNKGCQTNDDWILTYRSLRFAELCEVSDVESSRVSSSRSSVDFGGGEASPVSPPSKGGFFSHLLHGKDKSDVTDKCSAGGSGQGGGAVMQKSKSSSSVVHHGGRLMAKKIFKSRSKSQTRVAATPFNWTPQGGCVWTNVTGRQVILNDTFLLNLSEVERKVLQKVAIAKLQALNLGVAIKIPSETCSNLSAKPKRKPYMLKRRALTTSIFDSSRKDDEKDKDAASQGGLVFGIPLTQCVENDRLNKGLKPFRSKSEIVEGVKDIGIGRRHSSRSSLSSLIDPPRNENESLALKNRRVGSVPGLLDTLSCSSTADITGSVQDESSVPNIMSECFRYLEKNGLHTLGIFRVSTSRKRIRQLRENFDCGKETSLEDDQCPHDVATLLKEYLRDLPDPLLCRDLYHAFVHTQRIRNRRLQFEALQYLVQLLPPANRDTLYALLCFLANVAKNSDDTKDEEGNPVSGNKMDSNNLATVFAPNILHCIKPGAKEGSSDRPEDRIDIINIVRTLIDHYKAIFNVSAELLDEVYVHMMDSHPEVLDQLLSKKDAVAAADESLDELESETSSAPWSPVSLTFDTQLGECNLEENKLTEQKKTYSREEFLHEATATGPRMRMRHRDRIKERSTRRKDRQEDSALTSSAMTIISLFRGQKDDHHSKNRSSSLESSCSAHTDSDITHIRPCDVKERRGSYSSDNIVKASLTIPVHPQVASYTVDNEDIPYIEDDTVKQAPAVPPRRSRNYSTGSESSIASIQPITGSISLIHGYDSAIGSSTACSSSIQNTPSSISSVVDTGGIHSPPSWGCSPPTSPDSTTTTANYIPDEPHVQRGLSRAPRVSNIASEASSALQKIQTTSSDSGYKKTHMGFPMPEREPRINPSISNIGSAVMKSRTADFEKISKTDPGKPKAAPAAPVSFSSDREKKKYVKRRYTDSRHQTTHIPDSEFLESTPAQCKSPEKISGTQAGPVYKRRELISSVPTK
ncbi:unnamed protein product [Callosobruchus maculatus]|uniref:Rho-GAP domain-containing protein n=1 Tax=Callosobruchus maculatus TaxID=64391 RepID=A0A653DW32_CALMS|nr:unnamed protein product [Callosobruchus maculatus]